jgi:hypothetical protein
MSTNKQVLAGLLIGAVIAVAAVTGYWYTTVRAQQELQRSAQAIQLAVERYAVDNNGSYPKVIDALIIRGYMLDWPPNPFGPGRMQPLAPDAKPLAGGFVYIAIGPEIAEAEAMLSTRQEREGLTLTRATEFDYYELVFYGRSRSRRNVNHERRYRELLENTRFDRSAALTQARQQIQWDQVPLVLNAGVDIGAGGR